jgi:hypothetical protein
MNKETDQKAQELAATVTDIMDAMGSIDEIVRMFYKNLPALAAALRHYAKANDHHLGWVLKKAHGSLWCVLFDEYNAGSLDGVLWNEYHVPLNKLLNFQEDYLG